MEGLEISIINLSEVTGNDPTKRFDSEFFKKEYKALFKILSNHEVSKASKLCSKITQGPNPNFIEDPSGIPCLTGRNINKGRVTYINSDYISEDEYKNLKRFQILKGDTLITLKGKGSIGKIGYVTEDKIAVFSRNIGLVRPDTIDSGYLNAFILSKYGKKIIERGETGGTGQSTLTSSYLMNIDIPRLKIEKEIGDLIVQSEKISKKASQKYDEAENLLLCALGLNDFRSNEVALNVKSFKDSFAKTGRLDAEYFQPKYEEIIGKIKSNQWDLLGNIVNISKSIEPGSATYDELEGLPFYRVSDYNKFGLNIPAKNLKISYVENNIKLIKSIKPKKGTILFSKDGSVGTAYLLTEDLHGVTSGATLQLKIKTKSVIKAEYLTLALNSKLVKMQAERDAGGSTILHWRLDEIENVVVPIVDLDIQEKIANLIRESFILKVKSDNLLEVAKCAVEIGIEENEKLAVSYLMHNS